MSTFKKVTNIISWVIIIILIVLIIFVLAATIMDDKRSP